MLGFAGGALGRWVPYVDTLLIGLFVWYGLMFRSTRGAPGLYRVFAPFQPASFFATRAATEWPQRPLAVVENVVFAGLAVGGIVGLLT